jgi:hypothetical protein
MELVCTFWGDPGEGHAFDIYIDDEFLTNVVIHHWGGKFIIRRTHIPLDYTLGKKEVTVVFKANKDQTAGPVYECRLLI